jgi:hypothetical protein
MLEKINNLPQEMSSDPWSAASLSPEEASEKKIGTSPFSPDFER